MLATNAGSAAPARAPLEVSLNAEPQPPTANPMPAAFAEALTAAGNNAPDSERVLNNGEHIPNFERARFPSEATTYHERRWRTRFHELLLFREVMSCFLLLHVL